MFQRTLHAKRTLAVFMPQWTRLTTPEVSSSNRRKVCLVIRHEFPGSGVVLDPRLRDTSGSFSEAFKTTSEDDCSELNGLFPSRTEAALP